MFKRKILSEMIAWKESPQSKNKALVIKGMRQVGKTFIALEYAKMRYENVIYINFKNEIMLKNAFDGDLNIDRILMDLTAMRPDVRLVPGKTIIVFDEIQECANARASIKPFMEDGRYDIICTGSLLGIKGYNRKHGSGVPVGFEHTINMKSMDFEEFLWAKGIDQSVIDSLRACFEKREPVSKAVDGAMARYFSEYMCVGGLPRVVDVFLTTNDMNAVRSEQLDIIQEYRDDFGKHLDENEREYTDRTLLARINRVFDSIPSQLGKENKKFQYSMLSKNGRGSDYRDAIQWLEDSGIVKSCHNLSLLQLPLSGNQDPDCFKLYVQDAGLFTAMLEPGSSADILAKRYDIYNGAIYEEIVADAFSKMGRDLYYYRRDSGSEVDFIIRMNGEIVLVEVKAGKGKVKSADTILAQKDKYGIDKCIKIGNRNVGQNNGTITIPHYMTFLLTDE